MTVTRLRVDLMPGVFPVVLHVDTCAETWEYVRNDSMVRPKWQIRLNGDRLSTDGRLRSLEEAEESCVFFTRESDASCAGKTDDQLRTFGFSGCEKETNTIHWDPPLWS